MFDAAAQDTEFVQVRPEVLRYLEVMSRMTVAASLLALFTGCATVGPAQKEPPQMISMDVTKNPGLRVRIDNFTVPDAAREPFEAAMQRNFAFIQTLPGFQGHVVFEKTGGPGSFNIATIAVWESQDAIDKAVAEVGAFYKKNGINMPALLAQHGIKAELGQFRAVPLKE
ncbi:hypothetical protein D7V97_16465 [Corallococcus sp. CA053C]|uniref:antibiotic biosynthesis monooxygenase family protein n=1 Tax=Corallococcus sp. CA053C TaxID=2316732 RepID=UPI000EA142E3|nr:antibiotic biosynthesis monooxygenase family protein [Corallococcus sp. CA053C]RKH09454.1 hypothetical protein D7V97_16465 [Corallococcus sp. CA053C]